jgi:hypothetical protein
MKKLDLAIQKLLMKATFLVFFFFFFFLWQNEIRAACLVGRQNYHMSHSASPVKEISVQWLV